MAPVAPAADPRFEPPTLARRFGALVVDWALSILVASFFGDPVRDGWSPVVTLIAEYGFFVGLFGQTPGMRLARIRCVSFTDGGRIGVIRALLRGALLGLVVPALIMDRHRRGWHDRAVGSVVVAAPPRPAQPSATGR
ncbi:RDD family protein [Plantactinospora sp. CA-290183]|uniref:RDD family protein n=1 Tax=Plantactinospora sp. CA-290183 TaxID=3240006 RepID=UPI003D8E89B9